MIALGRQLHYGHAKQSRKTPRTFVKARALHDEPYKYSDHVVYTDHFWQNVKSLDRIWEVEANDYKIDSLKFIEAIEKRFGRKYECSLVYVQSEGAYRLIIGEYYFLEGDDYTSYIERMQTIVSRLTRDGISGKKILEGIYQHKYLVDAQEPWWVITWPL